MSKLSIAGEEKAWELISARDVTDITRAADVSFDAHLQTFSVRSFGKDFVVSPSDRTVTSDAVGSEVLLGRLGDFFRLSLLWYLATAKDVSTTGRLVKLQNIPGGDAFSRGSHLLPLDRLAARYGTDREGFLRKGMELGGAPTAIADAGLVLKPLPRIPVTLALWLADEDFPARADLLFDSTSGLQAPVDILWSIAMMTVLVML